MRRQLMPTHRCWAVSRRAHRPASSDRDLDDRVFDRDRIGPHWLGGRRVHHLARAHVEHAGVQRALDGPVAPVRVDRTFSQVTAVLRAFVVDGIEAAVDVDQGYLDAFRGDDRRGAGRDVIRRSRPPRNQPWSPPVHRRPCPTEARLRERGSPPGTSSAARGYTGSFCHRVEGLNDAHKPGRERRTENWIALPPTSFAFPALGTLSASDTEDRSGSAPVGGPSGSGTSPGAANAVVCHHWVDVSAVIGGGQRGSCAIWAKGGGARTPPVSQRLLVRVATTPDETPFEREDLRAGR